MVFYISTAYILSHLGACSHDNSETAYSRADTPLQVSSIAIFVLPDVDNDSTSFAILVSMLAEKLPLCQFFPCDVYTKRLAIEEQAHQTCLQMLSCMSKLPAGTPIVLIGHGQGGLRAVEVLRLAPKYLFEIAHVVTIGTPFQGSAFFENLKDAKKVKNVFSMVDELFAKKVVIPHDAIAQYLSTNGVKDLFPYSECLKRVKNTLQTTVVPILLIGGVLTLTLYPSFKETIHYLLTGQKEGRHDGWVALDSQLAQAVRNTGLQRKEVLDVMHDDPSKLGLGLDVGLLLDKSPEKELTSQKVANVIIEALTDNKQVRGICKK